MTKIILKASFVFLFLSANAVNAQNFNGTAVYESKTKTDGIDVTSNDMTDDMKKEMNEKVAKAFEKTYILNFNKFESFYFQEEKLEAPSPGTNKGFTFKVSGSDKKIYKNSKEKIELSEEEFFGKEFLVQDSLPNWNWKLESETKKIGNYTCHKATFMIPVSEEDKKEFENLKKDKNDGKTNLLELSEPKEKLVTAWYAPEIPVSFGPDKYGGLPGLILEINDGQTIILCSKISLNPKSKIEIKRLSKGKKVTQKQYEEIVVKQLGSMKNSKGQLEMHVGN